MPFAAMGKRLLLMRLGPLAGPVLDRELRVASRQRRSYVLRVVYVSLLTVFMVGVWLSLVHSGSSGSVVYQASRLATAGRYIAVAIVWFQFVAAQIAAPVLLGDAIRSEVRKSTLHLLAVTPLSGLQIVGGKLAGGLLPVVMLLATSLPLLALVRVFGGVPWDYLVAAVGITFSALVFAGALHLLVSTTPRRTLGGVGPALWLCLLLRVPDGLVGWFAFSHPTVGAIGGLILRWISPTDVLLARTREMLAARAGTGLSWGWPLHCLIVLAASLPVLLWTAHRVRTAAVAPPVERTRSDSPAHTGPNMIGRFLHRRSQVAGRIRRVKGSPVLWKELRTFAVQRSRHPVAAYGAPAVLACLIVGGLIGVVVFGVGSSLPVIAGSLAGCAFGLHIGATIGLSGAAATMIPKEREARTLPVLLTTPLENGQVVRDKALAVVRQSLPMLFLLFVLLFLSLAGVAASAPSKSRPLLFVQGGGICLGLYLAGLLGILPLLAGLGLYCGARFKTTAAARGCTSALVLLGVIVLGFASIALVHSLVQSRAPAWLMLSLVAVGAALACAGAGLILLWAAARRLRRDIF
jgi:ABC-type transport system involved in multi-copper enzyme maturation permease subunit